MESLYGAMIAPGCAKEGEVHVLRFGLDCVAGAFLPGRPDQLSQGLDFLTEFLARPRLEDGRSSEDVFLREQQQAVHHARAVFDDKGSHAAERCLALACEGEPMAIPEHGGVAAIEAMDRAAPDAARLDFLQHGELLLTAMGALPSDAEFLDAVGECLDHLPQGSPEPLPAADQRVVEARRATVERVDLQQSRVVLLFRLPPSSDPKIWMGRAMFASMLGGGTHSRLFREVREKQSLAYYAQATLDRHKALLTIHIGLDEAAAEAVETETMRQSDALMAGDFTVEELDTARAGVLTTITTLTDGIGPLLRFVEDQWNLGFDRTPGDLFRSYSEVTADDVTAGVAGLKLDYSYLLASAASGQENSSSDG